MTGLSRRMQWFFSSYMPMQIGSAEWKEVLIQGANAIDVPIDSEIADRFAIHAVELGKWTKKTNLTSITDPLDVAVKHFLDSIAPAPFIPPDSTMLDIGSGGGFPGIPLKILIPSLSITLVDASRKKVSFLNHVIRTLELSSIKALHMRIEDLALVNTPENNFDVIICRAFSALDAFVKKSLPLLDKKGLIIALKGKVAESEIETVKILNIKIPRTSEIRRYNFIVSMKKYVLPYLEAERSIVCLRLKATS